MGERMKGVCDDDDDDYTNFIERNFRTAVKKIRFVQ